MLDPLTVAVLAGTLVGAEIVAGLILAIRAALIPPVDALRAI